MGLESRLQALLEEALKMAPTLPMDFVGAGSPHD